MQGVRAPLRLLLVGLLSALQPASPSAAQDSELELLSLHDTKHVIGLGTVAADDQVRALVDGDEKTIANLPTIDGAPADIVFDFGTIVSPSRVTILLPTDSGLNLPVRFDVLASESSPNSGFRSLKAEPLTGLEAEVTFDFRPASARWLMIRLYPPDGLSQVEVGDVRVSGSLGPPETHYAFGETPAHAIEVLKSLAELEPSTFEPDATEAELFERAQAGRLSQDDFETVALLASGVFDPASLRAYKERIAKLEIEARSAIDTEAPPDVLGAELLDWMHNGPLSAGYIAHQTDISVLLDQGSFNCVSSAVLFAVLGRRLGLDVRGIEVPDHAFAIVYDGADHMDVETTTERGFDPARDRIAEFEALTGFVYIPEANRDKRREIGEAGMAALIYYNHGVQALDEGRYRDALLANFRALSLDPGFSTAATNALAALGRWSADLAAEGRWEDAAKVAATGTKLAPDDAGLAAARLAVWQGWAGSLADAGKEGDAVALLERAKSEMPDADLGEMQAWVYIRGGEDLAAASAWDAALQKVEPGRTVLQGDAKRSLEDWRLGVYLRWANDAAHRSDFEAAATTIEYGLQDYPESSELARVLDFVAQEWAGGATDYSSGLAALTEMRERFPGKDGLEDVIASYIGLSVRRAQATLSLPEAVAMVDDARHLVPADTLSGLGALVYETYGHPLIDAKDWSGAASVYAEGLSRFPDDYLLRTNALYVAQEWRSTAFEQGGTAALDQVNDVLAGLFPSFDRSDGEDTLKRRISDLVERREYDAAQVELDEGQLVLSTDTVVELGSLILDSRARAQMESGDWSAAAQSYADGLARFPESRILRNNAIYMAQEWTRSAEASGGVTAVLETANALRDIFPGNTDISSMGVETLKRSIAERIDAKDYTAAQGIIAAARLSLSQGERGELTQSLYATWAGERVSVRDWPGAAEVLAEGLRALPDNSDLRRNAAYVAQEWTAASLADSGVDGFLAAGEAIKVQFAGLADLQEVFVSVLGGEVERATDEGRAEEALRLIDTSTDLVGPDATSRLKEFAYDRWARAAADANDWMEAVRIYDLALQDVPESAMIKQNRDYSASKLP